MLNIQPMSEAAARQIIHWDYPAPWKMYSFRGDERALEELLSGDYYLATDEANDLVGFFCFGPPARVPGGTMVGAYTGPELDIGLGLRPDLTGKGNGLGFLQAGMDYASRQLGADDFRLTVLADNLRAIKVYERAGFADRMSFISGTPLGEARFILMVRSAKSICAER